MIYTDSDYFIQIYVGWGCQIKIDARNNFDVLSNGSPAEPSPPTALSASVLFPLGAGIESCPRTHSDVRTSGIITTMTLTL